MTFAGTFTGTFVRTWDGAATWSSPPRAATGPRTGQPMVTLPSW